MQGRICRAGGNERGMISFIGDAFCWEQHGWACCHVQAWRQGRTGYPLVDAGMRQLWSSGWLHNRCRVVCASFLVKNLLLPWQWGLKHYWDALLDADLECAALGWQYVSGCLAGPRVPSPHIHLIHSNFHGELRVRACIISCSAEAV